MKTQLILHTCHNEFSPAQIKAISELAERFDGRIRIIATGIQIYDITPEAKVEISQQLPEGVVVTKHKAVNSIVVCRGKGGCKNGFMETMELAKYLEDTQFGRDLEHKLRIGISGCPRSCADQVIKDIGVYGMPDGFTLTAGGTSGRTPKAGMVLKEKLSMDEAKKAIVYLIDWYQEKAMPKEHFSHLLERLGNPF